MEVEVLAGLGCRSLQKVVMFMVVILNARRLPLARETLPSVAAVFPTCPNQNLDTAATGQWPVTAGLPSSPSPACHRDRPAPRYTPTGVGKHKARACRHVPPRYLRCEPRCARYVWHTPPWPAPSRERMGWLQTRVSFSSRPPHSLLQLACVQKLLSFCHCWEPGPFQALSIASRRQTSHFPILPFPPPPTTTLARNAVS